jgi:hypothetical protein
LYRVGVAPAIQGMFTIDAKTGSDADSLELRPGVVLRCREFS